MVTVSGHVYTLHKPTRRRFTRRRVVVYGIDHQWQADLVDLAKLSSLQQRIQVLVDMYRRVIAICMGHSIEKQDGEDFERRVSGYFQIGAAPDTFTDRQRN